MGSPVPACFRLRGGPCVGTGVGSGDAGKGLYGDFPGFHGVEGLRMHLIGHGTGELFPECFEQRSVRTQVGDVIPVVVEDDRRVTVQPLQRTAQRCIEGIPAVDLLHQRGQPFQLGAVGYGKRPAGCGVGRIKVVKTVAHRPVVGRAPQVLPDAGVWHTVGHDFGRRAYQVIRHILEFVGHLDGGHITVVEQDK